MKIIDEWKPIKDFCGYYINLYIELNTNKLNEIINKVNGR